jgi:hypothetical protein
MKRRAAGQFTLFQQDDVGTPGPGKMIRDAGAENSSADYNDLSLIFQYFLSFDIESDSIACSCSLILSKEPIEKIEKICV